MEKCLLLKKKTHYAWIPRLFGLISQAANKFAFLLHFPVKCLKSRHM